jgi:hypothetical protein
MLKLFENYKLSKKQIIIIILLLLHLSPIWIFKYFPSQDGPSHIYNAYLLKNYYNYESYTIRDVYKLNLTLFPNWTSHLLMALLLYVFSPIVSEKILLSFCIVLPPLSLFYYLSAVDKNKTFFGFLGFIYSYNYLLQMGFYNFALSIPLFFFTLGYWYKHNHKMEMPKIGILYGLLLCTYFCHYLSYLLLVLSLSIIALFSCFYSTLVDLWGEKKERQDKEKLYILKSFFKRFKLLLVFLGYMLPAYFIAMSYYLSSSCGDDRVYRNLELLKEYLFDMRSLVYFRDDYIIIGRILLYCLVVAFLLTILYRIREVYKFRKLSQSIVQKERLWTKIINGNEIFLLLSAFLMIIYFEAPWSYGSGAWINDRILIYIFLVLLPFYSINFHRYIRCTVVGIIIVLSLWHLGYTINDYYLLNKDISDMISGIGKLRKHKTFTSCPEEWRCKSEYYGELEYVDPFSHIASYLCLEIDVADLSNYEAESDYFPIKFKYAKGTYPGTVDYILIWRKEYNKLAEIEEDYELVYSGKYNKLYSLRE